MKRGYGTTYRWMDSKERVKQGHFHCVLKSTYLKAAAFSNPARALSIYPSGARLELRAHGM
jgi:hypothetical protein